MTTKIDVEKLVEEIKRKTDSEQGYTTEYDGERGVIETPRFNAPPDSFDSILSEAGFDPEVFELVGPPVVKTWDAQTPDGVRRLFSYRLTVRRRVEAVDVDELVAAILDTAADAASSERERVDAPTVFAVGDLQLGKDSGDGTDGIVRRFIRSVDNAVERYRMEPTDTVLIAFLGDCIEGVVSQGGKVIGDSDLVLTDQLRLLRSLMTRAVLAFREVCPNVVVASVPGNHDQTHRSPVEAKPHDSFAVDSLRAVEEAFTLADRLDGLDFRYPEESELGIALEVAGVRFLLAHGHQWRTGKHFDWWKGQSFSRQSGHDASYLLAGHRHHFSVDTESDRFFVQVPSLEQRSDWWRNKTGQVGNPGAVYLVPGTNGQPRSLAVI